MPHVTRLLRQLLTLVAPLLGLLAAGPANGQVRQPLPFSFALASAATTSAGVYGPGGALVRTLWSGVPYAGGTHAATWDGLDDTGHLTADGNYTVKVLSNNVRYEWDGVIGNTSQARTGSSIHRAAQAITGMVVVGQYAYLAVGYTEGNAASYLKFDVSNPQVRLKIHPRDGQSTCVVASDGTYVYWGGPSDATTHFVAATRVADDTDVTFNYGQAVSTGHNVYSAIDLGSTPVTGLAAQRTGNLLLVAHASANQVRVLDKRTGQVLRSWAVTNPRQLTLTDDQTLWLIHDTGTVEKYTLDGQGLGTATGVRLPGLPAPVALAAAPNGRTLLAVDGVLDNRVTTAGNHQVKAYDPATATLRWQLGQAGGYAQDPTVRDDKFCFINTKTFEDTVYGLAQPYLACQPDGSFWVGDVGNLRSQHFSASRAYLGQLAYLGYFYSCVADPNAPQRVFANYLEFAVDYTKPLAVGNGSWRLVRNWSYGRQAALDDAFTRLQCLATLANGRTYALAYNHTTQRRQVIELPPSGNIRYTGVEMPTSCQLNSDGSLWSLGDNALGKPTTWTRRLLTGFDANYNPQWGPAAVVATTPPVAATDPLTADGFLRRDQVTTSGVVASFCSDRPNSPTDRGTGFHLGGVRAGTDTWNWQASPSTTLDYQGDFPADGTYDIGNGVQYAGSFMQALGRSLFWGYNGEFWKNAQTNKWNHYFDNGLLLGQFGALQRSDMATGEESPYGMASNAVTGTFVQVGDDYYLYHCDEGFHAGIHRWRISGLGTIQEQTVATLALAATPGVLQQCFAGYDLNNFDLTSSQIVPTVAGGAPAAATRFTGFVRPPTSESYTLYVHADQRVRLWLDGQLLVDQWGNSSPADFAGPAVVLAAGRRYPLVVEASGGAATLAWASASQPRQAIPATCLSTPALPDATAGIPLSEFLPYADNLVSGLYGWGYDPAADVYTPSQWADWRVRTNVTGTSRPTPDVNVQLHPLYNGQTVSVTRRLGHDADPLDFWQLDGQLTYPAGDCDKNQGHGYLQVLDARGRVIVRVFRQEVAWPQDYRLYLNSKVVVQTTVDSMMALGKLARPFSLRATPNGLTLRYAGLPPVLAPPFDPASDWQHPQTVQVLFSSPVQDEHELNLAGLRYTASTMPVVPTLLADDDRNTLSAWQSSGWSLLVSAGGGAFVPYTGQIGVGNVARPAGYWQFRLRDPASGRVGRVVSSPAFTATANPLPIRLLNFEAHREATGLITLSWRTALEANAAYFAAERSADGQQFAPLGNTVPARYPTGGSYRQPDNNPPPALTYYRLRLVDADGSFTYSPVVAVDNLALAHPDVQCYPNPAAGQLTVHYPAATSGGLLEVVAATGATVLREAVPAGSTSTVLALDALPPGVYCLRYAGSGAAPVSTLFAHVAGQ